MSLLQLQLIELLSVRAPSPEKKLKLLKEIAEEHELDWDPAASESEFFKSHEDLLVTTVFLLIGLTFLFHFLLLVYPSQIVLPLSEWPNTVC